MSGVSRVRQVILLLESLDDYAPAPETWTGGLVRRGAIRGPSPTRWQQCAQCVGAGELRDRFGRGSACVGCGGKGRVRVDGYTDERVVTVHAGLSLAELIERDTAHVTCNACQDLRWQATGVVRGERCWRCDGTGQMEVPCSWLSEPDSDRGPSGDPLADAISRRDRAGSYHELEGALGELFAVAVPAGRVVVGVHVRRSLREWELTDRQAGLLVAGVRYLAASMPAVIRVPRHVSQAGEERQRHLRATRGRGCSPVALQARNRELRLLNRQGRSVQWLAGEFGLSVSAVYRVVASGDPLPSDVSATLASARGHGFA